MIDIENYKNKRVAVDGDNAFTTPKTTVNVIMNASNLQVYIGDFSSLYSGKVRFYSTVEHMTSGTAVNQRLKLVDENGAEIIGSGYLENCTIPVEAGKVYKMYAVSEPLYGPNTFKMTEFYFTGAVVDTFCPVFIKA